MSSGKQITISLDKKSIFNDTNGDGFGEFQGFGTSLCWWANRVGYSEKLTKDAVKLFFNKNEGLGFSIGRYNIGGGDNVSDDVECIKDTSSILTDERNHPHLKHIRRSDSEIPGFACDVTKIDLQRHDISFYNEKYERVFEDCGFAWNYDWNRDRNQINVLKAIKNELGDDFICEAFSNSPPYFMTVSGCTSGSINPKEDNLREDSIKAFAAYLVDVVEHFAKEENIIFQSITPMNEPSTDFWKAYSQKQEGCHISPGIMQSKLYEALEKELSYKAIKIQISAFDETSIDSTIKSINLFSGEAMPIISRIDTHSYAGTKKEELRKLALSLNKNLWMSEVDGAYIAGENSKEMAQALGISTQIADDLNKLLPSAWIMWNAIDIHIDSQNEFDYSSRQECLEKLNLENGNSLWGVAIADHNKQEIILTKKYYGMGQYTRYIKPSYCLLESEDNLVCAYSDLDRKLVIVAASYEKDDDYYTFNLEEIPYQIKNIKTVRTSGSLKDGENMQDISHSEEIMIDSAKNKMKAFLKGNSITTFVIDLG
ncbi:glycoside hydrolase [Butyrivibrio sp. NC3005]|uniref:glycoside hydrolase n=1 Tax=Butyrivibrio sp. NC3005 TaxID=1280685 RepID=UPI0003FF06DA|nr:glycoside hydrolase [Butyrivibrio sp. NC3005]